MPDNVSLTFKIAWRNLWRHKGKSLVVGLIILIGALLMTVGNGMIAGMTKGLADNIVNLFTGDLVVISDEQRHDNVLLDFEGKPVKVIKKFPDAQKILAAQKFVTDYLPATTGMVLVFNSGDEMGSLWLLGVDIERYQKFFANSFRVVEGKTFKSGKRGVLISAEARRQAYDDMGFWLVPKGERLKRNNLSVAARSNGNGLEIRHELVFMGASETNATVDVRVPVTGIIKYKALNKVWGNYGIIDIDSFREANNYITSNAATAKISKEQQQLLESDQLDQMFGADSLIDDSVVTNDTITAAAVRSQTKKKFSANRVDSGSYNLIFLKIQPGISQKEAITTLDALFRKNHLALRAVGWKDAVGTIGSMAMLMKCALNVFIMFIFFVAGIVIMNTLSMAALERTAEIAMMRAIGAQTGFVRKVFIYETGMLAFCFGGLGIAVGLVIILLINLANFTTTNEILQLVYGGDALKPLFTGSDLLLGIAELAFATCLSVIYPLRIVGKIVPLDAIARE